MFVLEDFHLFSRILYENEFCFEQGLSYKLCGCVIRKLTRFVLLRTGLKYKQFSSEMSFVKIGWDHFFFPNYFHVFFRRSGFRHFITLAQSIFRLNCCMLAIANLHSLLNLKRGLQSTILQHPSFLKINKIRAKFLLVKTISYIVIFSVSLKNDASATIIIIKMML